MPEFAVILLKLLVICEPPLTAAVLIAFLRGRPPRMLNPMRSYLVGRLVLASLQVALICAELYLAPGPQFWKAVYFYVWLAGILIILFLLYRAAAAVLSVLLQDVPGLRAMARLLYRWLVVVAVLMVVPAAATLSRALIRHRPVMALMLQLVRAYALAELLPLLFTIMVAAKRRLSLRTRIFGILLGCCLEPACYLARSWFTDGHFWGWGNFWTQLVTDCTLLLWLLYFSRPEGPVLLAPASPNMLHWDRIAHRTLKMRRAANPLTSVLSGFAPAAEGSDRVQAQASPRPSVLQG
jgi:hypothetical protein